MTPELTGGYLLPFVLIAIRVGAALKLLPFFGGGVTPTVSWLALSSALSLVLAPLQSGATAPPLAGEVVFALATKELFIGVVIGTLARIAFSALEMVGSATEKLAMPLSSPESGTGIPLLYALMGTAVFLLIGGHHSLIGGLAASLRCMPVLEMPSAAAGPEPVLKLFTAAFAAAVLTALPIFAAGFLADLLVGGIAHIFAGAPVFGATMVRSVAVLLVAAASFGAVATAAVEILQLAMGELTKCGAL